MWNDQAVNWFDQSELLCSVMFCVGLYIVYRNGFLVIPYN